MSDSIYNNPKWIRELVTAKTRTRQSLGAIKSEYSEFLSLFNFRALEFACNVPQEIPKSKAVVEVVKKEYINNSEVDDQEDDEVEIRGQKSMSQSNTRNYQLTIGKDQTREFTIGGEFGLSASFFNVGAPGVGINGKASVNASYTRSTTEKTESQVSQGLETTLGKEYSIMGTISIPAKTKLSVTITTYTVTFKISDIKVLVSAPASAKLRIRLTNACCCRSKYCYITAEDFMGRFCPPQSIQKTSDQKITAVVPSEVTYLGEKTEVVKKAVPLTSEYEIKTLS